MAQAVELASKLDLQVLPEQQIDGSAGKLAVVCLKCGYASQKSYSALRLGKGCWRCGKKRAAAKQQLPEDRIVEACVALGHSFISRSGSGARSKVIFKCRYGVQHNQTQNCLLAQKGCGCKTVSSYEHAVRCRLETATGYRWPKITNRELRTLTGARVAPRELDLFCRELKVSVEVDGGFHRPPKWRCSVRYAIHQRTCRADAVRDAFVTAHLDKLARHCGPRPLIRINTDDLDQLTEEGLNEFVMTLLHSHGICVTRSLEGYQAPPNPSWQQDGTLRNRAAAEAKGCMYPDQPYLGVEKKHRFECKVHGTFMMRAAQMRQSRGGCQRCGQLRRVALMRERASQLL